MSCLSFLFFCKVMYCDIFYYNYTTDKIEQKKEDRIIWPCSTTLFLDRKSLPSLDKHWVLCTFCFVRTGGVDFSARGFGDKLLRPSLPHYDTWLSRDFTWFCGWNRYGYFSFSFYYFYFSFFFIRALIIFW